jgi:steroid 5-alpha reductase family enzyme
MTTIFLASAATLFVAMLALWALSLRLRDASIVDIFWGPAYALVAGVAAAVGAGGDPLRAPLIQALVSLWGLRLGAYLLWRNHGRGEDPRYQAMRRRHGERFGRVSLRTVFLLQGALVWIVSLPLQVVRASAGSAFGALDAAGVALFAVGFAFEAIGDAQLARFKRDPASRGQVMDRGLWRYTRHPNYFGDCCVWGGIYLIAAGTPAGVFTLPSPMLMSWLLLRVSGVPLLEHGLHKRRPGYAEYVARTSSFIPWRKRSAQRGEAERSR